jgi:hypothetical protein
MNEAAKTPPARRVPMFSEGCFELAGGSAVYETSPIGRRMQDIRVAARHVLVHARNYVPAGGAIMERLSAVH